MVFFQRRGCWILRTYISPHGSQVPLNFLRTKQHHPQSFTCRVKVVARKVGQKTRDFFRISFMCRMWVPVGILYWSYVGTTCGLAIVSRTIESSGDRPERGRESLAITMLFSTKVYAKVDSFSSTWILICVRTPLTYAFAQYNLIQPRPLKRSNLDTQELEFRLYNLPCSCMLTTVLRVTLEIQGR